MNVWIVTKESIFRGAFSSYEKALKFAQGYGSFKSDPDLWEIWEEEVL